MIDIVPLFPIPLAFTNIGLDPIATSWMKSLTAPKNQAARDYQDDHLEDTSKGMYILDKPQMKTIRQAIDKSIKEFVKELGFHTTFEITTSWLNCSKKGNVIQTHGHECSMISGVYYPEVHNDSPPITFKKSYTYTNLFHNTISPKPTEFTPYNVSSYTIQPISGDLIMFPSHLLHEVKENTSDLIRYSIGFNTFASGDIGVGQSKITISHKK